MSKTEIIADKETELLQVRISPGFGSDIDLIGSLHHVNQGVKLSRNKILSEFLMHSLQSGRIEKFVAQHLK